MVINKLFQSDIQVTNDNTALDVFVSVKSYFNATEPVFLYTKPSKTCPTGSNGQICSGNGECNQQQFTCSCKVGWESSDCSVPDNGGGTPNIDPDNPSGTIITPSGTLFDVGIVLINEIDPTNNNNIIQSYNISTLQWNNITLQDNQNIYKTIIQTNNNNNNNSNSNSTLTVQLNINNLNERIYYNFAGDIIPILPKSIKYQIELQNYTFSSSLNIMQFIFKSGIIKDDGECIYDESTSTQATDKDTIRSIQMKLNGETLIGTFSDRIVIDNRPSYNQVNKLTDNQIKQYNLNNQAVYVSITTSLFKQNVIVDPNFGVLISSKPDDQDKCKKKFASWKIALIVVFSVVGIASIITITMLIRKRKVVKAFNAKLKSINK